MYRLFFNLICIFFALFSIQLQAQKQEMLSVYGTVSDGYAKKPLSEAKVSLLAADSTVVIDSIPISIKRDEYDAVKNVSFTFNVKKEARTYFIKATCKGYDDILDTLEVKPDLNGIFFLEMKLKRLPSYQQLGEATAVATKLKMFYKGDTLVYDATAFKLPDGSRLDDLIRQLPGVTLNDAGEIFVNGRKVDELLLQSRTFMGGNKKVLLENLPYFTVKHIKVYEQENERDRVLGQKSQDGKYVMDVNLKDEYRQGYIGNIEVAGGTNDRWLDRGFLLYFMDQLRFTLYANGNNVNEKRHIGQTSSWRPDKMPSSLLTTRSVAGEVDYQSEDKNKKENFVFDFTSSRTSAEMRRRNELFLDGSTPFSTMLSSSQNGEDVWSAKNIFKFTKPNHFAFDTKADFSYKKYNGRFNSRREDYNTADGEANSYQTTSGFNEGHALSASLHSMNIFKLKSGNAILTMFDFIHDNNKNELARRYQTQYVTSVSNQVQHNASNFKNRRTFASVNFLTDKMISPKIKIYIFDQMTFDDKYTHDWLYHPDTLLLPSQLDALKAMTDVRNSYTKKEQFIYNIPSVKFAYTKKVNADFGPVSRDLLSLNFGGVVHHTRLDYTRGAIDTLAKQWVFYTNPTLTWSYYHKNNTRENLNVWLSYRYTPNTLMSRINFVDDATPQVVILANPNLKGASETKLTFEFTDNYSKHKGQMYHIKGFFTWHHRSTAQSVAYDPQTSVYTYMPKNVSGAYEAECSFDFTRALDKKQHWLWQTNGKVNYLHSLDHTMLSGETESHENAVNTLNVKENAWIQYTKDAMSFRLTGDFSWRHSEGKMRDFTTLNAFDWNYGLTARYTVPRIRTSVSLDATLYSRRGYGDASFDRDDFVMNVSLSQPFLKGRLVASIEAFDVFHQLSSTQYEVNAQGRIETWQKCLPNYVMLHLQWSFSKKPKV